MAASSKSGVGFCCLKKCLQSPAKHIIEVGDSQVNVRAFEAKGNNFAVDWKAGGCAQFHGQCWKVLVLSTKGVDSARAGIDMIQLSDKERSMILEARKTAEYHDDDRTFVKEATFIASILKKCGYCIAFTGAGISTAAGIGDFRGIDGKWTEREKKKNYGEKAAKAASRGTVLEQLRPTYTHEALVKLMDMGLLQFVISQNTDGLHRLSGIPADRISELHGNSFVEKCEKCDVRYERPFGSRYKVNKGSFPPNPCPKCKISHRTGRKCTEQGCESYLMNTIINFGDYLESHVLRSAEHHAQQAEAVMVLGSTLKVSPANNLVLMGPEPHRLIICNRQTTPYDEDAEEIGPDGRRLGSRVFGDCDRLMREVMRQLLPPADLIEWENGRAARMIEYGVKRAAVK